MATSTGSAGHAVAFIAHATPIRIAGQTGDRRSNSATARHTNASTGGSVIPRASGNATTGDAIANNPQRTASGRPATRNARMNSASDTRQSHTRASPASPGTPIALGSPNTVITGRYGL